MHSLAPSTWNVEHGHAVLEDIEAEIRAAIPNANSYEDMELARN